MALKGNLRDFSLTQLLNLIRLARKTGGLTILEGENPTRIFCEDGRLVYVSRGGPSSSLAQVALKTGRVTEAQLQAIRPQLVLQTDKELALRLTDLGFVSRDEVMQMVRERMLDLLYPLFSWSKGEFQFDPAARPSEDEIIVAMELDTVLLESGRRLKETGRLQESIPSLDVVARLSPQQDARMRSINLSGEQWKLISLINGRSTLRQIADSGGLTELQVRKVTRELMTAGLVELAPSGAAAERRPAAPPVAARPTAGTSPAMPRKSVMSMIDRVRRS